MKILHIALHFAEYALALSEALAAQHQVVTVLSRRNAEAELVDLPLSSDRHKVALMDDRRLYDPRIALSVAQLARLIVVTEPDVIHCQDVPTDYLVAVWPLIARVPFVLTVHDPRHHIGAPQRVRIEVYRRFLRRRADAVVVHGGRLRADAEEMFPSMRGRIVAIPHGPIGQGAIQAVAGRPDWTPGSLLFFGRVEAYKGLGVLIDALEMLGGAGASLTLTVAGCGSELERQRGRLARLGAHVIDRFIPASEVASLFRAANVVVLPYLDATGSGVAAMALRYGRPVVATNTGAIPELVRDGVNGVVVPSGDAPALATALASLVADGPRATRYAAGAVELAQGIFSWSTIAVQTADIYRLARDWRSRRR